MQDFLLFAFIPISSALVGWITNILAIKMTFYPLEFVGVRPFGWQGIIPSKARKMAEKAVDMLTSQLLNIEERFERLRPEKVAEIMQPRLAVLAKEIIDEVIQARASVVWQNTPTALREQVYRNFQEDLPNVVEEIIQDLRNNIEEILDLHTLGVEALSKDKALLNQVFIDCGREEFKFVQRSGLYFGLPFGLVQMSIALYYTPWWLLPLFGLMVGYATNWLALRLIFYPQKPKRYFFGLIRVQGLFIKRQSDVAREYAKVVANKILTTERMFEFMLRGPGADKLAEIVRASIERNIDSNLQENRVIFQTLIGQSQLKIIKNIACYRFLQELPLSIRDTFGYAEQVIDMENMLREKMENLSSEDFVNFLRPVFQEDEWILILVGAMLGMLAGIGQYVLLFT